MEETMSRETYSDPTCAAASRCNMINQDAEKKTISSTKIKQPANSFLIRNTKTCQFDRHSFTVQ